MRRIAVGVTLLVAAGCLLALPLSSSGKPRLVDQLRGGVDRTLSNANTVAEKLREQQRKLREQLERERLRREAAKRAKATPRAPSPGPQGTAYTPPLHGTNPHGQGTVATQDLPPSSLRPLPADPKGGNGEILVVGRSRGEQNANGSYHGHITVAALLGNEIVGVNTNPGETKAGPLDAIQMGLLTPLCNLTSQGVCLTALTADSATTAAGSTNKFSIATAAVGGPTGMNAGISTSNGNISEDANCQTARGDSNVANASVGGPTGLAADAIEATSTSKECKDGTTTQTNTSKVVNLRNAGLAVPPLISQMCANGVPNTPALVNILAPAVCNADQSNSAQAGPVNGNREGLTAFVLDIGGNALSKSTTAQGESRAVKKAQCSDGVDNDGDGKIDFPADPGCTSGTDDSEADSGNKPECSDGVDNDGDGKIDFPADPGCSSARDDSEANSKKPQCSDGKDNDGDGKVDFPDDPGCSSAKDDSERNAPECSDGRDNDGDGKVDFPDDPGCSSAEDDSEANGSGGAAGAGAGGGGTQCSDGVDNDGDRKVDFPADPGCSSAADDSESNGNGLAFTGTNVLLAGLLGSLLLLSGLGLRAVLRRRNDPAPVHSWAGGR